MNVKRFTRALLFCPLLLLLLQTTTWAQSKTVTGTVTDEKNAPVQGASVLVKGSTVGTQTDVSGNFSLNIPASATALTISYVGYTSQDVSIEGKTNINVSLALEGQTNLNEVVVIGYGTARKKDLTGAVASVTAKNFNQGVIAAPDQLLQNKVAGLEITNNSGQPGSATTIKIRGNNSIRTANNPLYVVDGVPLDGRTAKPGLNLGGIASFGTTPESNPLLYINPNDIAQVDVLKDASSSAIYGSRGANGVIVITTKKGTGGPTKIEFGTSFGLFAGYMKKYDILSASEFRDQSTKNNRNQDSGASVDALKAITRNDLTQNYSLSFSGGNETGKFRASFLGSTIKGFIKNTALDKYLANVGGTYKFLDKRLTLDFDLIAGHTTEDMTLFSNTPGAGGNLMSWALNWNPTVPFYKNGSYNNNPSGAFGIPNPIAALDAYNDVANVNSFLGNISATVNIVKGLDYKFLYAINHGTGTRQTNFDGWLAGVDGITGSGLGVVSSAALTSQTFTHTLNYNTNLTKSLKFEVLAGYEYWKSNYESSSLAAKGFNTNLTQENRTNILYTSFLQNASTQYPYGYGRDPNTEIQSVFGRVNFNFSDKYYITATLRADGSNKFGANNKYGYFPSVGGKWNIAEEDFLKSNNIISNLSVRASWGITGNQEFPSGASLEQFSSSAFNAAGQTNVANPDLKWEKTTSTNIGLDFGFMKNRLTGSIDYYHKNTTDLLFQSTAIQPAPASIYFINLPADLINSGVELGLNGTVIANKKFTWDLGFNIAYNKNMLKNFSQAPILTGTINGPGVSDVFAQRISNNHPVDVFYLKPFRGFDQSGNQIIGDTAFYSGDPNPHVIAGLSSTLRYNKLSFVFNFGGAFGYKIYNNTLNTVTNINPFSKGQNSSNSVFDKGEKIDDAGIASDRYLESGNYIKLRNATFSYAFGDVGKFVKNLNAFVSGTNLFVITKFKGFDPEVNTDKSNNSYPSRSIEYLPYPTARVITFGFNLGL